MRAGLVAVIVALLATPLCAQDAPTPAAPADVVVRESLDPPTGAVIGQHVALRVDVLFRGDMTRPPRVSLADVPGLQALRFESQGTTLRETIAGESYVGQRFEFALYARRGGAFDVPPASVALLDRQGNVAGSAQGEAIRLDVSVPPGVDASQPVVATRALELSEQWAPDPKQPFKAGDAIVRTITRTAKDVPGLAMRDLAFHAPEGVRVYVDPPDIEDRSNRGLVTGRRVDRITYVFERGGGFALPAVSQPWWDLAASALKTSKAVGAAINVAAPAPDEASHAFGGTWGKRALIAAGSAMLLGLLAFGARRALRRQRSGPAHAERTAFAAVREACSSADARAIYRAFTRWLPCLEAHERARGAQAAAPLDAALFSSRAIAWTPAASQELLARLASVRRSTSGAGARADLPPLNP